MSLRHSPSTGDFGPAAGAIVAAAAFGALAGGLVLLVEPVLHVLGSGVGLELRGFTDRERRFVERPETVLWLLLHCAQTALWAVVLIPVSNALRQLRPWRRRRVETCVAAALVAVLSGFAAVQQLVTYPDWVLPGQGWKLGTLIVFVSAVVITATVGIVRLSAAAQDASAVVAKGGDATDLLERMKELPAVGPAGWHPVERYLDLRHTLDRLLLCIGAIVGAAILAAGALRGAIISFERATPGATQAAEAIFPQETVLANGVFFSTLLGLMYLPAEQRLQSFGARLRDALCPPRWPPDPDWQAHASERSALGEVLMLDVSVAGRLRAGVAILAPLASSLVSQALGGG